MTTSPKPLTIQQLTTLKIIYKFRFITADLLSKYRNISLPTAKESLTILLKSNYIGRHYEKSYKLLGKGARYYLTAQSLKLLRDQEGLNERVLHGRYKDKSATEALIESSLEVFKTALEVRSLYPDTFTIFTQYELADYSYFPRPLPSLYLKRNELVATKPSTYFIELVGDTQFFVITKRIGQYIEHYESGEWVRGAYPQIIFRVNTIALKKRIDEYIENLIENGYIDEDELVIRATQVIGEL